MFCFWRGCQGYKNMKQIIETWFMEEFIVGNVDLTQLYLLGI